MLRFSISLLLLLLFVVGPGYAAVEGSSAKPSTEPTRYMIVVTGSELLEGIYADGHTYFLTRTLGALGLHCVGSVSVDDRMEDLKEAFGYAAKKAHLIIVTGGLGPTNSDITREAITEFTGIGLKEDAKVLEELAERFQVAADELPENLRRQRQVPVRGSYLKNTQGTAVGLIFEGSETTMIALPGPPHELQGMVREELVPYLSRRFGIRMPGCSITLRFVGIGQSQIAQVLNDYVRPAADIMITSQFKAGRVDFTFALPGDTPEERARLDAIKNKIKEQLGGYIYADDKTSLEKHVLGLLETRGLRLTVGEVGSGGSLTAALSNAEGAQKVLTGAYVAGTEGKLAHMLHVDIQGENRDDKQTIEQLAEAVAEATGSQCAIAVGGEQKDQRGAEYVWVALKLPKGRKECLQVRLHKIGEMSREMLSTQLLDQLRRYLE